MTPRELVGDRYTDALGLERIVPAATREAFIAALTGPESTSIAPATRVLREGELLTLDITLPSEHWSESVLWTVSDETGAVKAGTLPLRDTPMVRLFQRGSTTLETHRVTFPVVASSPYRATLDVGTFGHAGIDVVVAPARAYLPPGEARVWGLAVQLYTLRSQRNWGIGDLGDLKRVCEIAGNAGAALVGINPLHASHRSDPEAASPYAPTSRRFLNWLAIDVDAVPESSDPDVQHYIASVSDDLAVLRAKSFVDYTGVAMVKAPALKLCFAALSGARTETFGAYVAAGGDELRWFAIHEALVARYGRNNAHWPAPLRAGESDAVGAFSREEPRAIEFSMYLQWCAKQQLDAAAAVARAHGVVLYRDLAVGVESGGAEAWGSDDYVTTASVGAPPDLLNTQGQDWGLPPLSPTTLERNAYASFAGLLADNMDDAGALRIDHAMSLMRLFWIPRGGQPAEGAYVNYPFDDLLAIVARESVRAHCIVIGEDLGTVPSGFREKMAAHNILSYRILLFERGADGGFLPPEAYPELALATAGTHDLPPLAGWLEGEDIALHERLGLLDADSARRTRGAREGGVAQLRAALVASGDLRAVDPDTESVVLAAYRYLARSPARIVMVQIEDALGERAPVNIPGTYRQYPNWRRKLRDDLESFATGERFARFASALREIRPRA
ncbi:MAG: 4-alpha-glucanotransferase [Candidatus Lustribacter sp.]|jgi:4-alpha-glucanotransferase